MNSPHGNEEWLLSRVDLVIDNQAREGRGGQPHATGGRHSQRRIPCGAAAAPAWSSGSAPRASGCVSRRRTDAGRRNCPGSEGRHRSGALLLLVAREGGGGGGGGGGGDWERGAAPWRESRGEAALSLRPDRGRGLGSGGRGRGGSTERSGAAVAGWSLAGGLGQDASAADVEGPRASGVEPVHVSIPSMSRTPISCTHRHTHTLQQQ
ncbi:unnamed protein product [Lampetra fluviatilis]